ncbi:hypothetical protein [Caballeronia grimmiae]|uniref:hypothetical protein n=1 Tax=Caballeronia grimmiae TaxID=1071679 RepID=UPI0038BD8CE3
MSKKNIRQASLCLFAVAALSGCVSSEFNYTPPSTVPTTTGFSKTINKPRDAVWAAAVPSLGKDFFVINNIDKASGLINVSYSGDPHAYVDCGHFIGFFQNAEGRRDFSFDGSAKDALYIQYIKPNAANVQRHLNLEGRINIIFESPTPDTTLVTVNARYVLDKRNNIRLFTGQSGVNTDQMSFGSTSPGSFTPTADGTITQCVSTGKLERTVLDEIR